MRDFVFSQNVGPRGLVNIGQYTCYINATIQCLMGCTELIDFFTSGRFVKYLNHQSQFNGDIARSFADLVTELGQGSGEPYYSFDFLEMIQKHWPDFDPGRQMDVPEFMQFLLGALHEDLLVQPSSGKISPRNGNPTVDAVEEWQKLGKSIVSILFHSQIASFTACSSCPYSSALYPFSDIVALPVPDNQGTTIEDCLETFFAEETLAEAKCTSCSACSLRLKQVFGRVPPYLIVQLKRFHQHFDGSLRKGSKPINYTTTLDVGPHMISGVQSNTNYQLVGSINHIGKKLHNGHYTAMSKRENRWYCFDDSKVAGTTARKLCTDAGYLLLFQKLMDNNGALPFDSLETLSLSDMGEVGSMNVSQDLFDENPESGRLLHSDRNLTQQEVGGINGSQDLFDENPESSQLLNFDENMNIVEDPNFKKSDDNQRTLLDENMNIVEDANIMDYAGDSDLCISQKLSEIQITPGRPSEEETEPDCDHPSFDLDLLDPVLTEDDIPGAKLDLENIRKYKKKEIKFWLSTRGLLQKGKKAELVQRVLNHKARAYKIDPACANGAFYQAKRKTILAEAFNTRKKFPLMPLGAVWKPFPSAHIPNKYSNEMAMKFLEAIPEVRFSYAEGVVVNQKEVPDSDEEDIDFSQPTQQDRKRLFVAGTVKRANCFIDSGRVLSVLDCQRDTHYFVKATVQASMAKRLYTVQLMISKASGKICFTECQCKARALGRCCHIMSVLLLIGRHVQSKGHEAVTCTGRRCYWLAAGTSLDRRPGVVREKDAYYTKTQFHRQSHFDPRPTFLQDSQDRTNVDKFKNAVFQMPQKILWWYQLQQAAETEHQEEQLADDPDNIDVLAAEQIAEKCSHMLWKLNQIRHYSTHQPLHLPDTQRQSNSAQWFKERSMRATASEAHSMLGLLSARSTINGKINFFRKHVWGLDRYCSPAMEHGSKSEAEARRVYRYAIRSRDPELDVIETGMWVNPMYPMLSCSPDGIVVDTNGFVKLLEIKCPAVLNGIDPANFECLSQSQLRNFCLRKSKTTGQIIMNESHKWYYQIQMSMDILNLDKCDFVLYSVVNEKPAILTIEVTYNEGFWNEKRQRLIGVHRELLVPEHILGNAKKKRPIEQLVYTPFHEEYEDHYFWQGKEPEYNLNTENENEVLCKAQCDDL